MIYYHIRKPLKKVGRPGYRNPGNVERANGTLCGAEMTTIDTAWKDRNRCDTFGNYVPCPKCIQAAKKE